MKESILGYMVDTQTSETCADDIFNSIKSGSEKGCSWLACLNPHSYAVSLNDKEFAAALKNADWLIPDGTGVIMASRFLGGTITQRVTGSDLFFALHERMDLATGMSVFFLGGSEDTLDLMRRRMARDFPGIRVAGCYSPPFKPVYSSVEADEMISAINLAAPDVLWVGMTAPKQEKWIHENRNRLNVRFAGAIGAVFDFYTGRVKRSPVIFREVGLEWLPRLVQQPRRLWRRMFVSAPIFVWHMLRAQLAALGAPANEGAPQDKDGGHGAGKAR